MRLQSALSIVVVVVDRPNRDLLGDNAINVETVTMIYYQK